MDRVTEAPIVDRGATFSSCGTYRYRLWRYWTRDKSRRPLVFVCLNPSTATAELDDPTVRRGIGYARRLGLDGFEMLNLFAYRSTDPKGLRGVMDPVGPDNDVSIYSVVTAGVRVGGRVAAAWGVNVRAASWIQGRATQVFSQLKQWVPELYALRLSQDRIPIHPLMLPYDLEWVRL